MSSWRTRKDGKHYQTDSNLTHSHAPVNTLAMQNKDKYLVESDDPRIKMAQKGNTRRNIEMLLHLSDQAEKSRLKKLKESERQKRIDNERKARMNVQNQIKELNRMIAMSVNGRQSLHDLQLQASMKDGKMPKDSMQKLKAQQHYIADNLKQFQDTSEALTKEKLGLQEKLEKEEELSNEILREMERASDEGKRNSYMLSMASHMSEIKEAKQRLGVIEKELNMVNAEKTKLSRLNDDANIGGTSVGNSFSSVYPKGTIEHRIAQAKYDKKMTDVPIPISEKTQTRYYDRIEHKWKNEKVGKPVKVRTDEYDNPVYGVDVDGTIHDGKEFQHPEQRPDWTPKQIKTSMSDDNEEARLSPYFARMND